MEYPPKEEEKQVYEVGKKASEAEKVKEKDVEDEVVKEQHTCFTLLVQNEFILKLICLNDSFCIYFFSKSGTLWLG